MASQIEEILGRRIDSVKSLKTAIKGLQDSLVGLDAESDEFKKTSQQLTAAQDELLKVTKAGKQENLAAKDSLVGMRQEYKKLYDQYKLLSDEQRNSDFGKNMAASLETLSNKINDTQKSVGDFHGNIGRYASSVEEAFNKMGLSIGALKGPLDIAKNGTAGLGEAFSVISKHPILLALTAIVAVLAKAAAAIKNNEELTMRLHQAMAAFKPIADALANTFDFLAGILVKTVEGLAKVGEKILSIIPGFKAAAASHKELAKATDELTKKERELQIVNSKKTAEIERLREEASATDDLVKKQNLLQQAKDLQAEVDQSNTELAQERLRILEEYGEKTANTAEENNKLAEAQANVNQAMAQGDANARRYNREINAVARSTKSAADSTKDMREEARKLYEQTVENSRTEIQQITDKYEKEKKLLEKYHYDTTLLTRKYNEDINKIRLENLEQSRSDYERELKNLRQSGFSFDADALEVGKLRTEIIPAVQSIKAEIDNILDSAIDEATRKDLEDLFNSKNGFRALADDYKPLVQQIDEANSKYGLSITTLKNLEITIDELIEKQKELDGESVLSLDKFNTTISLITAYNEARDDIQRGNGFGSATEGLLMREYEILKQQKAAYEQNLVDFQGTQDQKLQILKDYYAVVEELTTREADLAELSQERTRDMIDSLSEAMSNIGSGLSTVKGSYESLVDSELKAGKIDEKQAAEKKKRLQKLEIAQQAFSIASITANAAAGIFDIWKGYATEVGTINAQTAAAAGFAAAGVKGTLDAKSLVSAIARTTSIAATATAQIMAAKNGIVSAANSMSDVGTAGVSVAATPMVIDSTSYSYAREMQRQSDEDNLNQRPLWVSVVDIENALGQQATVKQESSF